MKDMTSKNENIVFFDLETTGTDIKNDRIIQLGMLKVNHKFEILDAVEQKFNPDGVKSRPEAFSKHKITDEELIDKPKFFEVADKILDFLKDCDLGGHNIIKFDIPLLMNEMSRCGRCFSIEKRRIFDTKVMDNYYNYRQLEDIYHEYCPNGELGCDAHDAICDSRMCLEVYKGMLVKHNPSLEELDKINNNNTRIDMFGFFVFDENMNVCMGRGKHVGEKIENVDLSYFSWMMKQDFPEETINLAKRCFKYLSAKK